MPTTICGFNKQESCWNDNSEPVGNWNSNPYRRGSIVYVVPTDREYLGNLYNCTLILRRFALKIFLTIAIKMILPTSPIPFLTIVGMSTIIPKVHSRGWSIDCYGCWSPLVTGLTTASLRSEPVAPPEEESLHHRVTGGDRWRDRA